MTNEIRFYKMAEVAKRYRLSTASIRTLVIRGDLAANKIGGTYRISEEALKRFERQTRA
jgi:excisionase family DNA binding protein